MTVTDFPIKRPRDNMTEKPTLNREFFESLQVKYGRHNNRRLLNLWLRDRVPGGNELMELQKHCNSVLRDACRHPSDAEKVIRMIEDVRNAMIGKSTTPKIQLDARKKSR